MFDTIDHNILLNRLENCVGISGSALAWFKSYLYDRHQFVAVNEEVSYQSQVRYGAGAILRFFGGGGTGGGPWEKSCSPTQVR